MYKLETQDPAFINEELEAKIPKADKLGGKENKIHTISLNRSQHMKLCGMNMFRKVLCCRSFQ